MRVISRSQASPMAMGRMPPCGFDSAIRVLDVNRPRHGSLPCWATGISDTNTMAK